MSLSDSEIYTQIPAENLPRAKKFYQDTLGLRLIMEEDDEGTSALLFEAGKGTHLFIYKRARTKAEHTAFGFVVDNVESAMEEYRSRGVEFEVYDDLTDKNGIAAWGEMKMAWFKDPEGNIVAINNDLTLKQK
jgi:catechol 2,3-dioxygenase-like lactoylglutathione lyase family enzyme